MPDRGLRHTVALVGLANCGYFFVEFAMANVAVMGAAAVTLAWPSGWPDLIVGVAIAIMNADAAQKVWSAARREEQKARA